MHVSATEIAGVPVAFALFAATLIGVALLHRHTLAVALVGLAVIALHRVAFTAAGLEGLLAHLTHEWVVLANLLALLVGFSLLAHHFEETRIPAVLPAVLPDDWKGGVVLLALVFVLSAFLDNIAAASIGATLAASVYRGRVHVGFLAAVVAASNAGGSGSVIGDTTTTMMWIEGVPPLEVVHAYVASFVAFAVFAVPAARAQQRHSPIVCDVQPGVRVDGVRVGVVLFVLLVAIATNIVVNLRFAAQADAFPFLGVAVCAALLLAAPLRPPDWRAIPGSALNSVFLLALVTAASLMPVEALPAASWPTTFGLGFVSAVFDNIPLTKLALDQGGYDWGMLAYAVGFGGSITWFGSSAGVAVAISFPEARSLGAWLRHGWFVPLAYVIGFAAMLALLGWQPGGEL